MPKLIEVLAAMPPEQVEEIVKTWIANVVFGITNEAQADALKAIEGLRSSPIINALSDSGKAEMANILNLAERLINEPDEE